MANDKKTYDEFSSDINDLLTGFGPDDFDVVWDRIGEDEKNRYDRTFYAFIAGGLSSLKMKEGNLDSYTEVMREATLKILNLNQEVQILKREVLRYQRGY